MKRLLSLALALLFCLVLTVPAFAAEEATEAPTPDPAKTDAAVLLDLQERHLYSFMNCDTGRFLTCEGQEEFRLFAEGDSTYSLRNADGTKYLTVTESKTLVFSEEKTLFCLILNNEYQRVQLLLVKENKLLKENDKGDTAAAELNLVSATSTAISTGWYVTKHGDPLPLRVAMLGDSITNGCTPEGNQPKAGCRAQLSAALVEKYGRVVFVGSEVASHGGDGSGGRKTTVNEAFLYRSEGHNGWVVTSHEGYYPANNYGIDTLVPNLMTKYQPDIICMMIGINDLNQLGQLEAVVKKQPAGEAFFERWSTLAKDILSRMKDNGKLIVGTYTPFRSGNALNVAKNRNVRIANTKLVEVAKGLGDSRVSIAENYNHVIATGWEGIATDGIHLTAKGHAALGDSYYEAVTKVAESAMSSFSGEDTYLAQTTAQPDTLPETDSGSEEKGCGGVLSSGVLFVSALLAAPALLVRKGKED